MELYYYDASPPCRAVLLFVEALNLKPTMKEIDITKGENMTSGYLKLNPQHTVPLLIDGDFVLSESRAILVYLAEQYGQNQSYYPSDPKARGVIVQRLMFDIGTLYQRFLDAYLQFLMSKGSSTLDEDKVNRLREALEFLESFMGDSNWMAGDEITLADFSLVATISTIEACGFDLSQYEKVLAWLERCKNEMLNYEEANQKGADLIRTFVGRNIEN